MTLRDRCVCGIAAGLAGAAIVYAFTADARAGALAYAVAALWWVVVKP